MSAKFLISLDDKREEALNRFQEKMGCNHRVDAIRLLIDLVGEQSANAKPTIISVDETSVALLKCDPHNQVRVISKEHSPEISEWKARIQYNKKGASITAQTVIDL
jgi:hypothetical protein